MKNPIPSGIISFLLIGTLPAQTLSVASGAAKTIQLSSPEAISTTTKVNTFAPVTDESLVKVSDGTEIEIELANTLSGQEAKVGDVVDFIILQDITANGITIFERGASARARVTAAKKAGRWGRAGKLEWVMQDVQAIDGKRIAARFTKRSIGQSKGAQVAIGAVATSVLVGPWALFWGLKKGKPAIIPAGNRYIVFVHGDVEIKGKAAKP